VKKIKLRKGTILYHGTSAPDEFVIPDGPAWFSMSENVARKFVDWHDHEDARPRILKFKVATPPSLALLNDKHDLEELMEEVGIEDLDYHGAIYEDLHSISAHGYDGWTIPDNYGPGQADIMILHPEQFLEFVEEYEVREPQQNPTGLKPKLDELNRLAQTLTYYHWLKEHGISWSEIVGIRREPSGGIGFKLKDGRTAKFNHIPFGEEVIFNRPFYTPDENPDSLDRFRISRDKGKTWERITADMGFLTPDRQDRETLRQGGVIESEEGWLIKVVPIEPTPGSNPPATPTVLSRDYYHSTPDSKAGESIVRDGLIIPRPGKAGKSFLAPRKDFVYMAPTLYSAAIYALGGVLMGHNYPEERWQGRGRYGYIFLVHKGDLIDVEPDEDDVGELATADLHKIGPGWLKQMAEWYAKPSLARDPKWAKREKLRRAKDGEYAYQSMIGKQLLKRLSDDQKQFLMEMAGTNIANRGPVGFDAAWRLDKSRAPEIAEDGSNVLEIAERIK
jgi:hypothetical protein